MVFLKARLDQFVRQSFLPTDNADLRLKKVALTLVPLIIGPAAFIWGVIYCLLGHFLSGSIPLSYAIISAISLAYFFKTKETQFIQYSQLVLVLLLPFLLMWSLGGFSAGSMVMIWAIFAPVAALMFMGKRTAMMWFLMYLALILVSVLIDDYVSGNVPQLPDWVRHVFYLLNLGCGSAGLYMLLLFAFSEEKKINEINLRIAASAFESDEGILVTNASNEILRVNRAFSAITGFAAEEAVGQDPHILNSGRHNADFFSSMWDAISKNGTWEGDIWNRRKDGEDFPAHVIITAIKDSDGKVTNYVGTFSDITERTQSEAKLNDAHQKMASLLNSMAEGAYGVDLNGYCTFVNQSFLRILGYQSADEVVGKHIHGLIHHSHADGSPYPSRECKMYKAYRKNLNIQVDDEVFWSKDGVPIPVEYWSQPIKSENVIQGAIATFIDITERKHAEENLRITASVFDISQEGIFITDAENIIIDVNPAFSLITGYRSEEVIGKNPNMLSSGNQGKEFYEAMWQDLKMNKSWRGEIWNRRKNGELYPEILSISVLCDAEGKVLRHVAVFSDISNLKEHEAELNRIAHFDSLTGIPNRIMLADRMKQAIAQTSREQNMMALCYLDLDGFKPINDTLGHQAGDEVLVEIARRIGNTIRGGDTSARLGGDEFVILLLGLSKGEECVATLERLLASISQPILVNDRSVSVSASIGVSIYPMDDEDPDTLLRHADQAMYIAKQSGKNRFHIYDVSLDRRARDQNEFLKSIRYALEHKQFELHYQPKINLRTKELMGVEGLIRWRHPERGLLSPAEFMRYIENTGMDIEVGQWVTATALDQIGQWRKQGIDIEISINISGYHLESPGFVEKLKDQLGRYPDMPFGKLQIEVLETVALNDINIVHDIIGACHELGVGFALDDFGTGYSSLSYLSGLPVDVLKIDQSFVRDMLEDKGDRAIVQGIIALAQAFERQTVAEGIETDAQYQMLLDMGCELGQGYAIARPMPASDIAKWRTNGGKLENPLRPDRSEG
jgi:diguanylate cyclase (GGDEF)-like protein/PAS domain S-box-containing protein